MVRGWEEQGTEGRATQEWAEPGAHVRGGGGRDGHSTVCSSPKSAPPGKAKFVAPGEAGRRPKGRTRKTDLNPQVLRTSPDLANPKPISLQACYSQIPGKAVNVPVHCKLTHPINQLSKEKHGVLRNP